MAGGTWLFIEARQGGSQCSSYGAPCWCYFSSLLSILKFQMSTRALTQSYTSANYISHHVQIESTLKHIYVKEHSHTSTFRHIHLFWVYSNCTWVRQLIMHCIGDKERNTEGVFRLVGVFLYIWDLALRRQSTTFLQEYCSALGGFPYITRDLSRRRRSTTVPQEHWEGLLLHYYRHEHSTFCATLICTFVRASQIENHTTALIYSIVSSILLTCICVSSRDPLLATWTSPP